MRCNRMALVASLLLLYIDGGTATSFTMSAPMTPSPAVTTPCPRPTVRCPDTCVVYSSTNADGCPDAYCNCTAAAATTTTTTETTSTFETPSTTATTPEIYHDCFPPCTLRTVTDPLYGQTDFFCHCTTEVKSPPTIIQTTTSCPDLSTSCDVYPCGLVSTDTYDSNGCVVYKCVCPPDSTTTSPITCPHIAVTCSPGCVSLSTIPTRGCPEPYCECTTTTTETPTQTPTATSPSTTVTIQCPTQRVTCPYNGCYINSTRGANGCKTYYCDCKNAVTTTTTTTTAITTRGKPPSPTTTEITSTFETPSTTETIHYDCFPPCIDALVTGADGRSEHICDCTSTSPPTETTTSCPDWSTSCDMYPCELVSTDTYDYNGCLVYECVCPPDSTTTPPITCPESAVKCSPGCVSFSTIGPDGCPEYYCECTTTTTETPTQTPTATSPSNTVTTQCPIWMVTCLYADCSVYSTRGADGCKIYHCNCTNHSITETITITTATTTSGEPTTTTTTESPSTFETTSSTTITCPERWESCDRYGTPCESIDYIGADSDGCPIYQCNCPPVTETMTPDITTTPLVTCLASAIFCSPGCYPISSPGPDGCPVFQCFCETMTPTTTTPDSTLVTCPTILSVCDPYCVTMTTIAPNGCKVVTDCVCPTSTSTQMSTTGCPTDIDMIYICNCGNIHTGDLHYKLPEGCPYYECMCTSTTISTFTSTQEDTTVTKPSPCPEPPCRVDCRYVPETDDSCPTCDCSVITSSTELTTTTTMTSPSPCPEVRCREGCRYVPRTDDSCPTCDCSVITSSTELTTTTTTMTSPSPCPELLCREGCRYVPRTDDRCPWCDCSVTTSSTELTSPCPLVTCSQGCRHVIGPDGCPGCNCTQTTTSSSSTTTTTTMITTTEDGCEEGCEKIVGYDGFQSCQCPKTCKDIVCKGFKECVLQEVFCKKAPCFPVPTCVKRCDSCLAKPATEKCGGILSHRWTYDPTSNACKKFSYYGCIPSPNTYKTRKQCVTECKSKAPFCQPCGPKCYTLRRLGGCPECICPNPCKKFKCPKKKVCKLREMNCLRKPCRSPRPYCA